MKAIFSVDKKWGIGYKGELLKRIPDDMKNFRKITTGKVIVMGRETFESFPNKQPLKNRTNIVLTSNKNYSHEGIIVYNSIDELLKGLEQYSSDDVFVVGGESIYRQLLPMCKEVLVTKFEAEFTADRFFPNLDENDEWELVWESEKMEYDGVSYKFTRYQRK